MKGFLKSFLAGLLALIVFFGILFFASIGVVGALATQEQVALEPKSVLVIDLSRPMNDKKLEDPFADLSGEEIYPDLSTALALIEHASRDSSVKGIYLVAADNVNGFAASSELKEALKQFKATGKFIYAYGDYISQRAYALA
ncbi:MAG: signal peptide peptidase SppA, partial [Chitinophagaceae bacterium]